MRPWMVGVRPNSLEMVGRPTEMEVRSAMLMTVTMKMKAKRRQRMAVGCAASAGIPRAADRGASLIMGPPGAAVTGAALREVRAKRGGVEGCGLRTQGRP